MSESVRQLEWPQLSHDEKLAELQSVIQYQFNDLALLRRAVTHRSFANEQPEPRPTHNEAFEFLGDAVLEFLISSWLLERHPMQTEGALSKLRAAAVNSSTLQKQAARLKLGQFLLLNRGEEMTGGRDKAALQVDAFEALLAAIYLDGGIEAASDFVRREFAETISQLDPDNLTAADYKTALQERVQARGYQTPQYSIVGSLGPDHRRVFQAEVSIGEVQLAVGTGTTIKAAHQAAAREALEKLQQLFEPAQTSQ